MGTTVYECGCIISRSMFGDTPILNATPCYEHALHVQDELKALADKLRDIRRIPK